MRKIIFLIVLLVLGFICYNYLYQDHRDIEKETAYFEVTTEELANEFSINSSDAETKYLNKVITASGTVTEINSSELTIDYKLFCQLDKTTSQTITIKDIIKIKGRVIGYDDLLEQIKLDQCFIINN